MPRFLRIPLSGLAFLCFYGGASVIAWVLLPLRRRRLRALPEAEQRQALEAAWEQQGEARSAYIEARLEDAGRFKAKKGR